MSTLPATVDDYIAAQRTDVQPRLRELRSIIRDVAPDATEFISYGLPTYRNRASHVYFGAAKRHVALYGAAIAEHTAELGGYDTSKGTVRFPLDQPLPGGLVRKLVRAKLAPDQPYQAS